MFRLTGIVSASLLPTSKENKFLGFFVFTKKTYFVSVIFIYV